MTIARIRLSLAAALICYLTIAAAASGASAHGANGQPIPDAAHYLSTITGLSPQIPGLSARVDPRGEWLEVTNTTGKTLTILGYAREPYLQIDASGVAENSFSASLVLNQSLFGDLSQFGDSSLPPNWRHISDAHQARWHDHRIHWMGASRPPAVKANPKAEHLVGTWTVHMILASTPVTITGALNWLRLKNRLGRWPVTFLIADSTILPVGVAAWFLFRHRRPRMHGGDISEGQPATPADPVVTTAAGIMQDPDATIAPTSSPVSTGVPSRKRTAQAPTATGAEGASAGIRDSWGGR